MKLVYLQWISACMLTYLGHHCANVSYTGLLDIENTSKTLNCTYDICKIYLDQNTSKILSHKYTYYCFNFMILICILHMN